MPHNSSPGLRGTHKDSPEVDAVERRIGGMLDELEQAVQGEVSGIALEEVVDTDAAGRPVVKKAVDIKVQHRPRKDWSR